MTHALWAAIEDGGPTEFSRSDLESADDLFSQRAALFYTPTVAVPDSWVGSGPLQVRLPIAPPIYEELLELPSYRTPRLWVELLHRATHKLRWRPYPRAIVEITRFDVSESTNAMSGSKALLDSLKVSTTGRADGRLLHYFGATEDDSPSHIDYVFRQAIVPHPSEAHCTISARSA